MLTSEVAPETDQYYKGELADGTLEKTPKEQFLRWFDDAQKSVPVPEAVTFSTASLPSGRVSSRVVLMKELDKDGSIVIYSNWGTSKKSRDVKSNLWVALTFFWKELERSVRIEGVAERIPVEESQIYYDTRPRDSRIGAWASPQSQPVENRQELDDLVEKYRKKFEGVEKIPCPPHWGGLRIRPVEWEFWNGRPNRVHDRFSFTRETPESEKWNVKRLAP